MNKWKPYSFVNDLFDNCIYNNNLYYNGIN